MINLKVAIPAEHQAVIATEFIRIDDAATSNGFDRQADQGMSRHIGHNTYLDFTISLQDAKYRHFTGGATSPVAFASTAKIAFIQFDFTIHECGGISGVGDDRTTDCSNGLVNGVVGKPHLLSHFSNRQL